MKKPFRVAGWLVLWLLCSEAALVGPYLIATRLAPDGILGFLVVINSGLLFGGLAITSGVMAGNELDKK